MCCLFHSKLELFEDFDMRLFPILECLASVTAASGSQIIPYAPAIFVRCLRIISSTMQAYVTNDPDELEDAPVKDFAVCGLDVISGLVEGLGVQFEGLLAAAGSGPGSGSAVLLQVLFTCFHDSLPECRQSALSLAGELCKSCPSLFMSQPSVSSSSSASNGGGLLNDLILVCISNLRPEEDTILVCNNASWVIGELAVKLGGAILSPYIGRIVQAHMQLMGNPDAPVHLKQNLAITVGRLGVTNTQQMCEVLPEFFDDFCR
jgi:transportin-1